MNLKNEEGMTLILVLVLITIIIIIGATILNSVLSEYKATVNEELRQQAHYIAMSGAEIMALAIEGDLIDLSVIDKIESNPTPLANGEFIISLEKDEDIISINSTAFIADIEESLNLQLRKVVNEIDIDPLDMAAFTYGGIDVSSGTIEGGLGTNENSPNTIILGDGASIIGDITVGPLADEDIISKPFWMELDNNLINLNEERNYPLPDFPDFPSNLTKEKGTYTIGDYENIYDEINSNRYFEHLRIIEYEDDDYSSSKLEINVGTRDVIIRASTLDINSTIEINKQFDNDARVIFYVEEDLNISSDANININGNPNDVFMYYKGDKEPSIEGSAQFNGNFYTKSSPLTLRGSAGIKGNIISGGNSLIIEGDSEANVRALYAPNADIEFSGSGKVKGSLIGNSINMVGGASIEFAEEMTDLPQEDLGFPPLISFERIWK
ncbi:polymer-forming cytoskeletal protein [Natronospora cellulosivora (SeqCode)]